ncbi:unnamed protein product [Caenorhabditis brenneri]
MSERFKYAINGVYKCKNFEQHLAGGEFPQQLMNSNTFISGFYITFKIREEYNQVYPYIAFRNRQKRRIRAFFNIKSKFRSLFYQTNASIYLESSAGVSGPSINIQDVLNEEDGYLEDGTLTVEYGVHVDTILGYQDIWTLNLENPSFSSEKENNAIIVKHRLSLFGTHSPKPLIVFHSPLFGHETKEILLEDAFDASYAIDCLQIVNGVRLQYRSYEGCYWFNIAKVGRKLNMMNVVHYCDSMIIRTCPSLLETEKYLKTAIKLNMRQCAPRMIELWNFKELLQELREDLEKIPGEMMKVITRKFINEEF